MGFTKHGVGEILPEQDESITKDAASKDWSDKDQRELDAENEKADR